jgi:hypothetical protein
MVDAQWRNGAKTSKFKWEVLETQTNYPRVAKSNESSLTRKNNVCLRRKKNASWDRN